MRCKSCRLGSTGPLPGLRLSLFFRSARLLTINRHVVISPAVSLCLPVDDLLREESWVSITNFVSTQLLYHVLMVFAMVHLMYAIAAFAPPDLRRTCAMLLGRLEVPGYIIDLGTRIPVTSQELILTFCQRGRAPHTKTEKPCLPNTSNVNFQYRLVLY